MLNQSNEVLLITQNSDLISHVERVTQSIDLPLHCTGLPPSVHQLSAQVDWGSYPYILVGEDLARECSELQPPRRGGIAIVHCDREQSPESNSWEQDSWERELWKHAVSLGASNVVGLPSAEFWLRDALADVIRPDESRAHIVTVMPGSGGAGASTLAVNLGLRAVNQGLSTLVIDGNPLGGGIDLTLGAEEKAGTRWCDIDPGGGRIAAGTLANALPVFNGLSFLSHGRAKVHTPDPEVFAAVVDAGRRAFELVVVDLSHGLTPSSELLITQSDLAVIVVRNHVRSVAASATLREWIHTLGGKSHCVVTADHKGVSVPDIALALGEQEITELPFIPSMSTRADEGEFPSMSASYSQVCDRLLELIRGTPHAKAA